MNINDLKRQYIDNNWAKDSQNLITEQKLISQPQYKELSDDEIMNTFEDCLFEDGFNAIEFARAILMKARGEE